MEGTNCDVLPQVNTGGSDRYGGLENLVFRRISTSSEATIECCRELHRRARSYCFPVQYLLLGED
jgi:hypothetical protein